MYGVIVVLLGCCRWTSKVNELKTVKSGHCNWKAVTHRVGTESVDMNAKGIHYGDKFTSSRL